MRPPDNCSYYFVMPSIIAIRFPTNTALIHLHLLRGLRLRFRLLSPLHQFLLHIVSHRIEPLVRHRLLRGQTVVVVVHQRLVQEVEQIVVDELLGRLADEIRPGTPLEVAQETLRLLVQFEVVLGDVLVQLLAAQHLLDLPQLLVVVLAAEEGRAVEHDAQQHARQRPDVQRVVVVLVLSAESRSYVVIREQLGTLVVARAHTHVVLLV